MLGRNIREELLKRFVETNKLEKPLSVQELEFKNVTIVNTNGCNTRVTIECLPECRYYTGSHDLYYNRVNMSNFINGLLMPTTPSFFDTFEDLVLFLRDSWQLPLEPEFLVPRVAVTPLTTLMATEDSLQFIPNSSFNLRFLHP